MLQATRKYKKRPVLLCLNCKTRKVKCNKGTPCAACTRKGIEHLCTYVLPMGVSPKTNTTTYDNTESTSASSISSTLPLLLVTSNTLPQDRKFSYYSDMKPMETPWASNVACSYMGINPYVSLDETINFYEIDQIEVENVEFLNTGPLSGVFMEKKDIALSFMREYANDMRASNYETVLPSMQLVVPNAPIFESSSGYEREKRIKSVESKLLDIEDLVKGTATAESNVSLASKILSMLPTQKLILISVEHYFSNLSITMGILDEKTFRRQIERILGPLNCTNQPVVQLKIKDRDDLSYIGILLVVMRLGYLSVISNNRYGTRNPLKSFEKISPNAQYLMDNPITLSMIELAQECFEKFPCLYFKPSLNFLQFAMFIQFYQKFAPEFGSGTTSGESQLFTGVIIELAYSLGLNRDPDDYTIPISLEEKNIRRRIWHIVTFCDLIEAYTFGTPLKIDTLFNNTKLPLQGTSHNARDIVFCKVTGLIEPLRGTLRMILDMSGNTKMAALTKRISDFEEYIYSTFGTLKEKVESTDPNTAKERTGKTKIWLSIKAFLVTIYAHFCLHYEKRNKPELAYFYCRKVVCVGVIEFMPYFFKLAMASQSLFGFTSDLVITPFLLLLIHRVYLSLVSVYIRMKFSSISIQKAGQTEALRDRHDKLLEVMASLEKCLQVFLIGVSKLSYRYYYAWRIQKSIRNCLRVIKDEEFYNRYYPGAVPLRRSVFSDENLEELIKIVNLGIQKLEEQRQSCWALQKAEHTHSGTEQCPFATDFRFITESPTPVDNISSASNEVNHLMFDDDFNLELNDAELDELWHKFSSSKDDLNIFYDF